MYPSQKLKTSDFSLPSDLSHSNSVMRRLTQPCSAFQESLMKQSHLTVFQHSLFWSATLCLSQSSTPTAYLDSQSGRAFHNSGKSAFMVNLWAQMLLLYDLPSIKTEVHLHKLQTQLVSLPSLTVHTFQAERESLGQCGTPPPHPPFRSQNFFGYFICSC